MPFAVGMRDLGGVKGVEREAVGGLGYIAGRVPLLILLLLAL